MDSTLPYEVKLRELIALIERLRGPDGCPWDRAQTTSDIGRYLIEEAYEVVEAIEDTPAHLREELGDLLFHILFLARMAEEAKEFTLVDLLAEITAKMIRRHPHVFGDAKVGGVDDIRSNWERIKTEVEHKGSCSSLTEGLPRSLSTLARAQRITARASEAGFDWPDIEGVLSKVSEELAEFRAALQTNRPELITGEAGDLLFTLVNLCRFAKVDAEAALRTSLKKFTDRFSHIERRLASQGRSPRQASQVEMDLIWEDAKKNEGIS